MHTRKCGLPAGALGEVEHRHVNTHDLIIAFVIYLHVLLFKYLPFLLLIVIVNDVLVVVVYQPARVWMRSSARCAPAAWTMPRVRRLSSAAGRRVCCLRGSHD